MFSRTVIWYSPKSWKMMLISLRRLAGLKRLASCPFTRIWPLTGAYRPVISLTMVVLPAPLAPTSASAWPRSTRNETLRSTSVSTSG